MSEKEAASSDDLRALHSLVARSLAGRIEQDMADNIPTDAATLGAAIKFLKDNSITADPADADDLKKLRESLTEAGASRRNRTGNVLDFARQDQQNAG